MDFKCSSAYRRSNSHIWSSEALVSADLHVLSRRRHNQISIIRSEYCESPLVVVLQNGNGGIAGTSTLQANFKSRVWSYLFAPNKLTMSDDAVDWGRCHDNTIFCQRDRDGFGVIHCQGHVKVDSIVALYAKLAISLLCIWNSEVAGVHVEVVSNNLFVFNKSYVLFNLACCCRKTPYVEAQGSKPGVRIMELVRKSLLCSRVICNWCSV